MSPVFLDINDTCLSLTAADEVVSSPGAVLSDAGTLHFGEYAVSQLKRRPLDVKSDYWSQLSTAPLSAQFGSARHTADLVYEHLKSLIPHPRVIVASVLPASKALRGIDIAEHAFLN